MRASKKTKQLWIRERLDYELRVIEQMGFAGYFCCLGLSILQWQAGSVGPGRGSAAGN